MSHNILYNQDGQMVALRHVLVDTPMQVFREYLNVHDYIRDDYLYFTQPEHETDPDREAWRFNDVAKLVRSIKPVWYRLADNDDERVWDFGSDTWVPETPGIGPDARHVLYWEIPE